MRINFSHLSLLGTILITTSIQADQSESTPSKKLTLSPQQLQDIASIKNLTGANSDLKSISSLISKLGDDRFQDREEAEKQLIIWGDQALPALKDAKNHRDAEVRRRAARCANIIANRPNPGAKNVISRLLKTKQHIAFESLLEYLPYASFGDMETICLGLDTTRDFLTDNDWEYLKKITSDRNHRKRAFAGCLIARKKADNEKATITQLLSDPNAEVRLRTAQGLIAAGSIHAIDSLIRLSKTADKEIAWQAQELLDWCVLDASLRSACQVLQSKINAPPLPCILPNTGPPRLILVIDYDIRSQNVNERRLWIGGSKNRYWAVTLDEEAIVARLSSPGILWIGLNSEVGKKGWRVDDYWQTWTDGRRVQKITYGPKIHEAADTSLVNNNQLRDDSPTSHTAIRNGHSLIVGRTPYVAVQEADRSGKVVWEAATDNANGTKAASYILPLLSLGFATGNTSSTDLESPTNQCMNLYSSNVNVRRAAAIRLCKITFAQSQAGKDDTCLIASLCDATTDTDEVVKRSAIYALQNAPSKSNQIDKALLNALSDARVRSAARVALVRRRNSACSLLLKACESNSPTTKAEALLTLAEVIEMSPEYANKIAMSINVIENCAGDRLASVRAAAVNVLGRLGNSPHSVLRVSVGDSSPEVRQEAIYRLAKHWGQAKETGPVLRNALADNDANVQLTAVVMIGNLKLQDCVPQLLNRLNPNSPAVDVRLRTECIIALGKIGDPSPEVLKSLTSASKDKNRCIREAAFESLQTLRKK